jgi:hypothetical protein
MPTTIAQKSRGGNRTGREFWGDFVLPLSVFEIEFHKLNGAGMRLANCIFVTHLAFCRKDGRQCGVL